MLLVLMILAVLLAVLWRQVRGLHARIELLERAGIASLAASATPPRQAPEAEMPPPAPLVPPQPVPEPVAVAATEPPPAPDRQDQMAATPPRRGAGFEDMFGRRLPIWAGGVTLAIAGFLIVKYSIEIGLVSPAVRVVTGLLFGGALIAGAETALRREAAVGDPRVRQALAGAGIATLYAAVLVAANLYHLVGPATAFAGLALVTALAGALSIRFGAPSAVLGLLGGLAAPALVGARAPDVPLLTLYLALAVGALCALGRRQRWWWLGAAALAGGFGWGTLLILGGALDLADALSVGLYTLALAIGLPLLLIGDRRVAIVRLAGGVLGCAQLAALVAVGGFAPLDWALFGLLSVAIVWLSRREALFADVPVLGLGVAILLAFAWPAPGAVGLALLLAAMTAIHAVPAALRLWRADARPIDAVSVAAVALAIGVLPAVDLRQADTMLAALTGAALAAGIAALGWRTPSRRDDARFATLAVVAAVLLALAGAQTFALWAWAPMAAVLAAALVLLGEYAGDARVARGGWGFALATLVLLLAGDDGARRLIGAGAAGGATAFVTWAVPAAVAAFLAWRAGPRPGRLVQPAAVAIGYGAVAQMLPAHWLPVVPALAAAGLALTRRAAVLPGLATAALLMAGWAVAPLTQWLGSGTIALTGALVRIGVWPAPGDVALRLALPGVALAFAATMLPMPQRVRGGALAAAGVGLTIAAHVACKQVFAIDDQPGFVRHAMAERTLWEMLLAAAAVAAWRGGSRMSAIGFAAAGLLHFGWFTALVANPLLVPQEVDGWLIPAYATAGVLLWWAPKALPGRRRARDRALMALTALAAFTLLRQALHRPMLLSAGTGEGEQIARSVLAILLAGGFLWIGIARRAREWRIASLGLMLVAVVKVFLFDAAGLDGLARIASFAALGFSLIGVGWLYSRYLPDAER